MAEMKSLTIKGNYYEIVDEKARKTIERDCSPVLKETASGFYNVADDSANKPLKGLRVFGKTEQQTMTGAQMITYPYFDSNNKVSYGVTWTINDDGSVYAKGTAASNSAFYFTDSKYKFEAGTYTISGSTTNVIVRVDASSISTGSWVKNIVSSKNGAAATFTISDSDVESYIFTVYAQVLSGVTASETVYPMLCSGSSAMAYEPYTGGIPSPNPSYPQAISGVTNTKVSVYGKNLLPYPYYFAPTGEANSGVGANGASFTNIGNGGIKASGTPTGYASAILTNDFVVNSDIAISLIGNCSNVTLEINLYDEDKNVLGGFTGVTRQIIRKADYPGKVTMNMSVKRSTDKVAMSGTVFPMIVAGTVPATEYIPYSAPQTITIPALLHGMYNKYPETYLNSYEDNVGTGYISDYVEFGEDGSGKLVSRFWVTTLTGEENISAYRDSENTDTYFGFQLDVSAPTHAHDFMQKCSHFTFGTASTSGYYPNIFLCHPSGIIYIRTEIEGVNSVSTFKAWLAEQYAAGTPVQFVFVRTNPEVRSLSDEEITAFKQLYSNYLNTTVTNDSEVWTETDYVADLETFINNAAPKISVSTKGKYSSSIGFYTVGKELTVYQPNGNTDKLEISYESIPLIDTNTGVKYAVSVENGNLVVRQTT